ICAASARSRSRAVATQYCSTELSRAMRISEGCRWIVQSAARGRWGSLPSALDHPLLLLPENSEQATGLLRRWLGLRRWLLLALLQRCRRTRCALLGRGALLH